MLFKSFFKKFQPDPKAKNNWLMPFRKSGVKVNLKSIQFDRNRGASIKNQDIHSIPRRTTTLPKLQKVDSFLSNPASIKSTVQDEALFSKMHNTRKNIFSPGIIILSLLILGVFSAGGYFFVNNKLKDRQQIIVECDLYVASQKKDGFISPFKCDQDLKWYEYLLADSKAQTQYDNLKNDINKQIQDQQSVLDRLDKDIRSIKQNLADADPAYQTQLPTGSTPVPNTIKDKQNLLNSLKELLVQKDASIQSSVKQFEYLVKISPDIDSTKEQAQIKNFDSLAKSEKYSQYTAFIGFLNKFKENLISQNSRAWYKNSLNNPDLYTYKVFAGDDFKNLIDGITFTNTTQPTTDLISITGDDAADRRIIDIAESRGYKKRPLAGEAGLVSIDGQRLQPAAKEAFENLIKGAAQDGIDVGLVSGFRSISEQKSLFLSRFRSASLNINNGKTYSNADIVLGKADEAINKVLSMSSIPGYSRHHTGFTVDITDLNGKKDFTLFADTEAYKWISANNYFNAKRFGFVPSYPPNSSNQGPEPESWEYVYVGVDAVK